MRLPRNGCCWMTDGFSVNSLNCSYQTNISALARKSNQRLASTGVEFQIKHMKDLQYGLFEGFFIAVMD